MSLQAGITKKKKKMRRRVHDVDVVVVVLDRKEKKNVGSMASLWLCSVTHAATP